MPTPNDGTTTLPSDVGGLSFWGLWDSVGAVFRAWRGDANGSSWVLPTGYTTVGDDRKLVATAGVRVQLSAQACKEVIITALYSNTGVIVVGGSTVVADLATRRGIPLNNGDSVGLHVTNANLIYLDSTVNSDGISYMWCN